MKKEDLRIIYMGTPDFAVEGLKVLVENGYNVVGVVTNSDKPAGRGQKIKQSPIKVYAQENNLTVLQPEKFRDENFISQLKELKADLQIVVAFKMLPEIVWDMPTIGTLNLHASLLPQYRGAAPINWAIINGDKVTGNTTFFIEHQIDTGNIILQQKVDIDYNDNAGTLHDKLMVDGGKLILETVDRIIEGNHPKVSQASLMKEGEELKSAPKIFKDDCKINWGDDVDDVYNFIRGLSPYPAAWTEIVSPEGKKFSCKMFDVEVIGGKHKSAPGQITTDEKSYIYITTDGGLISIKELQVAGKKRMDVVSFLNGFKINNDWKFQS